MSNKLLAELPRFPTNIQQYRDTVDYWDALVKQITSDSKQAVEWVKWFENPTKQDGTPYLDDGYIPIYSSICRNKRKGFVITQFERLDGPKIGAWMDIFDDKSVDQSVEKLVINTVLSKTSERIIRQLIHAFIVKGCSQEQMEGLIEKLCEQG